MKRLAIAVTLAALFCACSPHRTRVEFSTGSDTPWSYDTRLALNFQPPNTAGDFAPDDYEIRHDLFVMLDKACTDLDNLERVMNQSPDPGAAQKRLEEISGMSRAEIEATRERICEHTSRAIAPQHLQMELRVLDLLLHDYALAIQEDAGTQAPDSTSRGSITR